MCLPGLDLRLHLHSIGFWSSCGTLEPDLASFVLVVNFLGAFRPGCLRIGGLKSGTVEYFVTMGIFYYCVLGSPIPSPY